MASLKKIEQLAQNLLAQGIDPNPDWIKGLEPNPHDMHISGQMREMSDHILQFAYCKPYSILLGEAAERLDDAHEEWMTQQIPLRTLSNL